MENIAELYLEQLMEQFHDKKNLATPQWQLEFWLANKEMQRCKHWWKENPYKQCTLPQNPSMCQICAKQP